MEKFFGLLGCGLILFVLARFWYWRTVIKPKMDRDAKTLKWLDFFLLMKNGSNITIGDYNLVSFDAGATWYHYEKIDGPSKFDESLGFVPMWGFGKLRLAEPKTLQVIEAFEHISDAIRNNKYLSVEQMEKAGFVQLKKGGFVVETKEKRV